MGKQEPDDDKMSKAIMFGQELDNADRLGGHWYMDLIDSETTQPHANLSAILVERDGQFILAWRLRIYLDAKKQDSDDKRLFGKNKRPIEGCTRDEAMSAAIEVVAEWSKIWNCEACFQNCEWNTVVDVFKGWKEKAPPWLTTTSITTEDAPPHVKMAMKGINERDKYRL